jgi:hypothetical protein
MALKDEARPIYLKVVGTPLLIGTEQAYTDVDGYPKEVKGVKAIIGAMEFNTKSDRQAWADGEKVYHDRKSYEITLGSIPSVPAGWAGTLYEWIITMAYQVLKSTEAKAAYPELEGLTDD